MTPSTSRCLTYLLLLVPPLVISFYLLVSFPTPPSPLPLPVFLGLRSLLPDSRAREIYSDNWAGEEHYADFPMGRTRYWLAGPESGKKIVLIHGLFVPALVWAPLVPQLVKARHRVLLYDLYGPWLALLLQHVGWPRARLVGVSMGGAIAAAFVATFPNLVENVVVLVACAGLVEDPGLMHELVRLQSGYLPGFNRAVSSSLRTGPITDMRWAFESSAWEGRRVLVVHGTADHAVPPAHAPRIKALIEGCAATGDNSTATSASTLNASDFAHLAYRITLGGLLPLGRLPESAAGAHWEGFPGRHRARGPSGCGSPPTMVIPLYYGVVNLSDVETRDSDGRWLVT
ncbi:Alpha/Beta hydrolase protein [Mycena epipterygia]|nr:Alpha/Beta hydrolase protein [Mycena epipterygia]